MILEEMFLPLHLMLGWTSDLSFLAVYAMWHDIKETEARMKIHKAKTAMLKDEEDGPLVVFSEGSQKTEHGVRNRLNATEQPTKTPRATIKARILFVVSMSISMQSFNHLSRPMVKKIYSVNIMEKTRLLEFT